MEYATGPCMWCGAEVTYTIADPFITCAGMYLQCPPCKAKHQRHVTAQESAAVKKAITEVLNGFPY